jgi:hypothetical protein
MNGVGLEADAKLLRSLLQDWGHTVNFVPIIRCDQIDCGAPSADVNIFLELIPSALLGNAKKNWFIPNPEWFSNGHRILLPKMDKILCKTQSAFDTFEKLVGKEKCEFIKFESPDMFDPAVVRKRKFLHVAGSSGYKNSQAVGYAFGKFFDDRWDKDANRELVWVGVHPDLMGGGRDHQNITYIPRAGAQELKRLMNECQFHIMPSQAEGWGHVIHEGLSCGAVMITTNAPPMNEFFGAHIFIQPQKIDHCSLGTRAWVGAYDVKAAVDKVWKMRDDEIYQASWKAMAFFAAERDFFRTKFRWVVDNG